MITDDNWLNQVALQGILKKINDNYIIDVIVEKDG